MNKINVKKRIKKIFTNKRNIPIILLLLGSGIFSGTLLNIALGFSFYDSQGILGGIISIVIVHWMA